jgi:hypothetical protein
MTMAKRTVPKLKLTTLSEREMLELGSRLADARCVIQLAEEHLLCSVDPDPGRAAAALDCALRDLKWTESMLDPLALSLAREGTHATMQNAA